MESNSGMGWIYIPIWLLLTVMLMCLQAGTSITGPFTDSEIFGQERFPQAPSSLPHTQQPIHNRMDSSVLCLEPHTRLRGRLYQRHLALRRAYLRAVWATRVARLILKGALPMAALVGFLTRSQLHRYLGSLPVLYALLESLHVRSIINQYCPTRAKIDHGAVAMILILNRLVAPRPLYRITDWLSQTVLVHSLGVDARIFNDDRLERTLDALYEHSEQIWMDVVHQAIVRYGIDLHFFFYDLTAFVVHGEYKQSRLADFGFAHNTPSGKRKIKLSVDAARDGSIPLLYETWSGRTADLATVQTNMERLCRLLRAHGYQVEETIVIGDRANLNDELAIAYDKKGLKYLAGLQPQKKAHRQLLGQFSGSALRRHPLTTAKGAKGYWGMPCRVLFEHEGKHVVHRGLVVLSGPMATAIRKARATQLRELRAQLRQIEAKIGQPRLRTVNQVQSRANTCLRNCAVGKLMQVVVHQEGEKLCMRWKIDRKALLETMRMDGRYLLVTNTPLLPAQMLTMYRAKDGVEKRFTVTKQDLRVSPIYLHKDQRIEAMLFIHMLALLVYSILEREAHGQRLTWTARRIIEELSSISVIETYCWDGSVLYRITPLNDQQLALVEALHRILTQLHRLQPTLGSAYFLLEQPPIPWTLPQPHPQPG